MKNNQRILYACALDGNGKGIVLGHDRISETIKADALTWIHMDATNPETMLWLEKEISYLDHIIIDALLADGTRPRIIDFEEGVLLILRGVNLNENSQPEDMVSIRLWIDRHRIISIQRRPLRAIQDIQHRLEEGKGPKNSGDFLIMLTAHLFEHMESVFIELSENLDIIEERIMESADTKERQEITVIRKQAIVFRRYIAPQRDVISHLRTSDQSWLDQIHKRHLQESMDQVISYVEDLDTIRERAQIIKDELSNVLADRINKNMYVLSVIASIFLPLGFFTSLMGMNISGMPGIGNANAFWIFSGILMGIVALQIITFKKLKWF